MFPILSQMNKTYYPGQILPRIVSFVHFGRIEDTMNCFRDLLTFNTIYKLLKGNEVKPKESIVSWIKWVSIVYASKLQSFLLFGNNSITAD